MKCYIYHNTKSKYPSTDLSPNLSSSPLIPNLMHVMKSRGPSTDPSPFPSSVCWWQTQCIWWRTGHVQILLPLLLESVITNSMHMMKSIGPSTDPSPTPSWVCWLQTPCRWWRAGVQVLILLLLLLESVDCKLHADDKEQGSKYWSFSHSILSPLIANSVQMMKSRGTSTDPSPTPSSVCWLQTQCIWWRVGQVLILLSLLPQAMYLVKNRGPSAEI